MTALFDTLKYVKAAKESGFTEKQAEFQANELSKWFNQELVTREYLDKTKKEIIDTIIIRLGGLMIAGITLLGFLLKH